VSVESMKAAFQAQLEEVWHQRNVDALDRYVTADTVGHDPATGDTRGIEAGKKQIRGYLTAFPDLKFTIDEMFGEGNMLCARWHTSGTHQGELAGIPPTGRETSATGISIDRFEGDLVAESWTQWDNMGLMTQLGAIPERAPAHA